MIIATHVEDHLGGVFSDIALPPSWQELVMNRLDTSAQTRNTGRQTRLLNQLERAKQLYLMGDFTKKEYLLEKARVESAIAELAPVKSTSLLDAGEFLQDFGQIWRVATEEERKKLLGSTIDIAYVLEGSILTINTSLPMLSLSPFVGHLARYPVELSIPLAYSAM